MTHPDDQKIIDKVKNYARQYYFTAAENDSELNLQKAEDEIISLLTTLRQQSQKEKEEAVARIDMEIYALEETLEKSKELSVAVGHKRVYERIKLISEYKGKLEAWKEIKELFTPHNN